MVRNNPDLDNPKQRWDQRHMRKLIVGSRRFDRHLESHNRQLELEPKVWQDWSVYDKIREKNILALRLRKIKMQVSRKFVPDFRIPELFRLDSLIL
jgi:hypothetical protein